MKKLTIGMAVYEDYDGLYFTIQSLRMYQEVDWDRIEFLVIDNCPSGKHSQAIKDFVTTHVPNSRYIGTDKIKGTAVRELILHESQTEYVLCLDSHVMLEKNALKCLFDYYDNNPDTRNLIQGPLIRDCFNHVSTHMTRTWNIGFLGVWGSDSRGIDSSASPFEIEGHGLGLFSCRKEAWPGFNSNFKGFGGEEFYIHDKFKSLGAKTLCIPGLRWLHRFGRPLGTQYLVTYEDRVRNYLLGFDELKLDIKPMLEHFEELLGRKALAEIVRAVNNEKLLSEEIIYHPDIRLDQHKILIVGKSGTPVSQIGFELSRKLNFPFRDLDQFRWKATIPPNLYKREESDYVNNLIESLEGQKKWVLSCDDMKIMNKLKRFADVVIYLDAPLNERIQFQTNNLNEVWKDDNCDESSSHFDDEKNFRKVYFESLKGDQTILKSFLEIFNKEKASMGPSLY